MDVKVSEAVPLVRGKMPTPKGARGPTLEWITLFLLGGGDKPVIGAGAVFVPTGDLSLIVERAHRGCKGRWVVEGVKFLSSFHPTVSRPVRAQIIT